MPYCEARSYKSNLIGLIIKSINSCCYLLCETSIFYATFKVLKVSKMKARREF